MAAVIFAILATRVTADDEPFITPVANSAVKAYQRGLERIDESYRDEQLDALKKYQNDLNKELSSSTRSGNQEAIQSIEAILKQTNDAIGKLEGETPPTSSIDVGAPALNVPGTSVFERTMAREDETYRRDRVRLLTEYVRKLTIGQKSALRKGDKADAEKIGQELEKAQADHQQYATLPPRGGRDLTISSTDGAGSTRVAIGPLLKGRTLYIQYLSGKWTDYPRASPGSPDDFKLLNENVMRPRLCAVVDEKVIPIFEIRGGTARKPFQFKARQEITNLVLNNPDAKAGNNKGAVTYRVWVEY